MVHWPPGVQKGDMLRWRPRTMMCWQHTDQTVSRDLKSGFSPRPLHPSFLSLQVWPSGRLTVFFTSDLFLTDVIAQPRGPGCTAPLNNLSYCIEQAHAPLIKNRRSVQERRPRRAARRPGTPGQGGPADGVSWGRSSTQLECAKGCISWMWVGGSCRTKIGHGAMNTATHRRRVWGAHSVSYKPELPKIR